jgi:hypothetical protein
MVKFQQRYQNSHRLFRNVLCLKNRRLLMHGPLAGGFRPAVVTRERGLLITASDELDGKPILGG